MRSYFTLITLVLSSLTLGAQTIAKLTSSVVSGTVCPVSATLYEVSVPSHLTSCKINWSVANGQVTQDQNNQRKATVVWNDTPGAQGMVTATFTNCSNEDNNGTNTSKSELILSIKDKAWGSYNNLVNINYCTSAQVNLSVPRMFVEGTGGIAQPALTEVIYGWTLPSGWREVGTHRTGFFGTTAYFVAIEPVPNSCSKAGTVTVQGVLNDASLCSQAGASATASIVLSGPSPNATVTPQAGYTGAAICKTSPVTFYASTNISGCISSYAWTKPPSWTEQSRTGNSITLIPSGTQADSGPIGATINFSCGSSVTSSYTPSFSAPSLSGPDLVCGSGSFSVQNASGVAITWSSNSPNVATVNSSGVVTQVGEAYGQVTATATYPCAVSPDSKTFWVGVPDAPAPTTILLSSNGQPAEYTQVCVNTLGNTFYINQPGYVSDYTWSLDPPTASYFSAVGNYADVMLVYTGTYQLFSMASNACGSGSNGIITIYGTDCGGGGGFGFSSYPNPATDELTIQFTDSLSSDESKTLGRPYQLTLFNKFSKKVYSTRASDKKIQIPLDGIPKGTYYLSVHYKDVILRRQIIVN